LVEPGGELFWNGKTVPCALGRSGVSTDKKEGDGASPVGCFPLKRVLFRDDRLALPLTALEKQALAPNDGWCDDPADSNYNRPVRLPYAARHEALWRDDGRYDLLVVLGHNDDPVIPGAGSAIFLHVAAPGLTPTEGCVAVRLPDLLDILADCRPGDRLCIAPPGDDEHA
jgi:L,D-peptidoglycan transpeptidase YkuD (ErfK/YbiS/YcfS/YnhG family)